MCCPVQGSVHDYVESKVATKMPSGVRVSTHVPPSDHTRQRVWPAVGISNADLLEELVWCGAVAL